MNTATAINPQSSAPPLLPPTPRDFDILRMSHVLHLSTHTIADKHHISQTRVRQIVHRVCHWLAANLPAKTEADQQAEARLAQHLAADQLQHQLEQLRIHFDATGDPKYLRHQTRVIAALARLGIISGTIDSLAADLAEAADTDRLAAAPTRHPTPDLGPSTLDLGPISPPPRACSASLPNDSAIVMPPDLSPVATASSSDLSDDYSTEPEDDPQGLKFLEQRLLTLLDFTYPADQDRRQSLETTLASVRKRMACTELRITPHHPGAVLHASVADTSPAHAAAD